jgi:hypothetical protein
MYRYALSLDERAGHVALMGGKSVSYSLLVRIPEEKRLLGGPGRRWIDNVKIDLGHRVFGGVNWFDLARDRDQWRIPVNTVMNVQVP